MRLGLRNARTFIIASAISAVAAWGYSSIGNVLLLLTTAWFAGFAISTFSPSRTRRLTGLNSNRDVAILTLTLGIFSFVAYFAIQSHWFLLAHGTYWTLVGLRKLFKRQAEFWYSGPPVARSVNVENSKSDDVMDIDRQNVEASRRNLVHMPDSELMKLQVNQMQSNLGDGAERAAVMMEAERRAQISGLIWWRWFRRREYIKWVEHFEIINELAQRWAEDFLAAHEEMYGTQESKKVACYSLNEVLGLFRSEDLSSALRALDLPVSGTKANKIDRLIAEVHDLGEDDDAEYIVMSVFREDDVRRIYRKMGGKDKLANMDRDDLIDAVMDSIERPDFS